MAPLLAAVLVFAPLIKGGNRPLALLVLELAAVVLLVALAMRPQGVASHLSRPLVATQAVLLALPLVQLVPLPESLWAALPGRDAYLAALASVGLEPGRRTLSLLPRATESSWLALLPPVAVFLATVVQPDRRLRSMVRIFLAMAVVQAVISLAQFGTGSVAVFWYVEGLHDRSGIGTYANRDHLAGLLEMALPLALALLAANLHPGSQKAPRHHGRSLGRRLGRMFSEGYKLNQTLLYAAACVAILIGLIFTRSRTGVALGMLAILLCAIAFARRIGGERSVRMVTVLGALGLALAVEIGLAPVLSRFTELSVSADARWSIYSATVAGIGEFFPAGSGIGTYPEVFRRFQPGDVPGFVNNAHNDYLEWLFEGGVVAGLLILAFLVLYLARWPRVWSKERWSQLRFLQVAAGISLLLMGLHGLIDFNLHIPANAIYFAFLAGLFFHREEEVALPPARQQRTRASDKPPEPLKDPFPAPPSNVPNPFAE